MEVGRREYDIVYSLILILLCDFTAIVYFRLKHSHMPEEYILRSEGREYLQLALV